MQLSRRNFLAASALLAAPAYPAAASEPTGLPADRAGWPQALVMGTGRPGGEYTLYGPEWGSLIQQNIGVAISYRASGGAASDILLIEQAEAQLGMTTLSIAEQARAGSGGWTAGVRFLSFRALFPIFPSVMQIVTPRGTGIRTLAGLAGQTIGTGPEGSSGAAIVPAILAALGIRPGGMITGDFASQTGDMLAGRIAACAFFGAPPLPAITMLQHQPLALIGFTPEQTDHLTETLPGMSAMDLPAGLFNGQRDAVASIGTSNFAIAAATLPDALVASLTLSTLRNRGKLAALVPAAASMPDPAIDIGGIIPYHPGAVAALRSLGLDTPGRTADR